MKRFLSILIAVVALSSSSFADSDKSANAPEKAATTTMISGTVQDFLSGESIVGAEVQIQGTDIKAYTDFDGNFEFKGMKPGKYNIVVSYVAYTKSLIENVDSKNHNAQSLDVKLQEK